MGERSINGWREVPRGVIERRLREWAKTGRIEVIEKPGGLWWRVKLDIESDPALSDEPKP